MFVGPRWRFAAGAGILGDLAIVGQRVALPAPWWFRTRPYLVGFMAGMAVAAAFRRSWRLPPDAAFALELAAAALFVAASAFPERLVDWLGNTVDDRRAFTLGAAERPAGCCRDAGRLDAARQLHPRRAVLRRRILRDLPVLLYQRSEVLTAGKRERAPPLVRRDPTSTSHRRRRLVLCRLRLRDAGVAPADGRTPERRQARGGLRRMRLRLPKPLSRAAAPG